MNRKFKLVGDNYLGRLKAASGLVREAGLSWVLRGQSEDLRHARQADFGPPSAQVQVTSQHAQPSRIGCQGRHQRAQRAAHRARRRVAFAAAGAKLTDWANQRLARHQRLAGLDTRDDFPRNALGKVLCTCYPSPGGPAAAAPVTLPVAAAGARWPRFTRWSTWPASVSVAAMPACRVPQPRNPAPCLVP